MDSSMPTGSSFFAWMLRELGTRKIAASPAQYGDRDVDEEHRPPPIVDEEEAAHDGSDRHAETGGGGPDADGAAAVTVGAEDVGQDRERGGHQRCCADSHHDPAGRQQPHAARPGREGRPRGEDEQPGEEHPFPPGAVSECAEGEQQSGEGDGIGVDDPLQLARRGVQVFDDGRERDVQDGEIEAHQ
jgi:hypothetical protein